jgi:transposase
MGEFLIMSKQEVVRGEIMLLLERGIIKNKEAAERLKISRRQVMRLHKNYRAEGVNGLVSKRRGKPSNRSYREDLKKELRELIETKYRNFGPKFAAEKLEENENISLSRETVRKLMIEWKLWNPKSNKEQVLHQQRARRECFGELIQIDGSQHDWFEDRGIKCCLIVFIDDATSKIVGMNFVAVENTLAYFECMKKYIKKYGRPMALYSDKHSIFRVNRVGSEGEETQFKRAMSELNIETICAHSPQAKGRVERANRTLQDRLIKEMRLRGISDIATANEYVEEFMEKHNKKFGKKAMRRADSHRKTLPEDQVLDVILSERYSRKVSKNLEFSFESKTYQVAVDGTRLGRSHIIICRGTNNEVRIWHNNNFICCKEFKQEKNEAKVVSCKELNNAIDMLHLQVSKNGKPWKQVPLLRTVSRGI